MNAPRPFFNGFGRTSSIARSEFIATRPYGNIGNRKCDGLLFVDGIVFVGYSPDELTQADLITKIEEDLKGAAEHWKGTLKEWIFVYNVRCGLPPPGLGIVCRSRGRRLNSSMALVNSSPMWAIPATATPS